MLVRIATSADSPPRLQGKVVELDRFSAQVVLETREPALRQGASVWLHFDPPGGGSPLSVAGIISGVARGGRMTVLLSLSPREYSRLRGLPEPPVQRARRAVEPPSTLPGIRPIQEPKAPEPRPEPGSSRPGRPVEAPAAVEPDLASLSPIERVKALAAAVAEMVGPRAEPASPRPVEPAEAPSGKVETQPASASPPEPVSVSPVEPVEALVVMESSGEPVWLRPAEEAEIPVELVELPPESAGVSPPESVEAPAAVEPAPEPVIPSPIEPAEVPTPTAKPSVVRPGLFARLAAALVGTGPTAEPASPRPVEPSEPPVEKVVPEPEPVSESPEEPVEAPAGIESGGEPAWLQPGEEAEAPVELVEPPPEPAVEIVAPQPEPVNASPVEPVEAPPAIESGGEPAWLWPAEEAHAPVELGEPPPEPASVSPREQAEMLIIRGDLEGAWKVYYDALRVEPDDLRLWYGLGRTLSRLNRRNETQEIFEYVVSLGNPDSEEVKHARQWLVGAGLLAEPAAPAVPAAPRSPTEAWATVGGKVTWGKPEPPREAFLVVQGLDKDGIRSHARVPFGQSYQFDGLPAGAYHLIGGAETEWLWDLRFTVEAGQELVLDLSRHNSTNPTARV